MIKRKLNIEIASEIVDLLMDMSSEVFDMMRNRENKKMNKEEVREIMNIFKEGKKVSLRNVTKKTVAEEDGADLDK